MYTQEDIIKAFGPYQAPEHFHIEWIQNSIERIAEFPLQLQTFFSSIGSEHEMAQYRPDSWTFRQIVHHIADSHIQAFCRFKLALTEEHPTIKAYSQNAWANTPDSQLVPLQSSIEIIKAIHHRWTILLKNMKIDDFSKSFHHPDLKRDMTLGFVLGLYAWHGTHHLTQMERYASNQAWL
jgi:hypothetical protein